MNQFVGVAVALAALVLAGPTVAQTEAQRPGKPLGSTYKYLHCNLEKCDFYYSLGEWATKEFRGQCTGAVTPSSQTCSDDGHSSVTCTITAKTWDYRSCSCTNWSTDTSHDAKITVVCD